MRKSLMVVGVLVLLLGIGVASHASNLQTPSEVVAELTGLPLEELQAIRGHRALHEIVIREGVLEEFKARMLDIKKEMISKGVENGRITEEQASELIGRLESKLDTCDGEQVNLSQFEFGIQRQRGKMGQGASDQRLQKGKGRR